jgi:hypothetical protein
MMRSRGLNVPPVQSYSVSPRGSRRPQRTQLRRFRGGGGVLNRNEPAKRGT